MWFVQWSFWELVAFVIEDSILSDIIKHQHNFAKDTLNIVDDSHSLVSQTLFFKAAPP